jgi:16S rRNA (cytidine1402-2'-O)-methyltransferase
MPGTLFVVATPIGNLEDISARALRVLREVAVIAAEDTRRTGHLLARFAITTPSTSLHEHNERSKSRALIARLLEGQSVALVSDAGTPTVSDPGLKLIQQAIAAQIRVEPIPGPSAIMAALSASGMAGETFTFLGFPPTRAKDRKQWFDSLANAGTTVVFFEAPHRFRATLKELQDRIGNQTIVVARELTKAHEELVRRQISELLAHFERPLGEFTIIVNGRQIPEITAAAAPDAKLIAHEFGELTESRGFSRRQAAAEVARRHGLATNIVYSMMETHKKSGE